MNKVKKGLLSLLFLTLFAVLMACGSENAEDTSSEEETNKGTISIGQIDWAENIAVTNMWKYILEDEGYDVELTVIGMGTTMQALESQELDASLEIWLPVQDKNYYEEYNEVINFSEETWFDNAKVGLVVPSYLEDINSVEDLNANKELFNSEITGFGPGAGTMEVTEELITAYDLDYELLSSSEPAMIAAIDQAIKNEEAIVSPLWTPHWVFSEYDLKFLDDPENIYGGVEKIHHATRHGFEEDFEEVDQWFKNWKMNDEQIGELINYVEDAEEPIDGAGEWVEENRDLIGEWMNN
ncbi:MULTISPECIES: glycine betaine ABC transporter substrate-binding protein [Paraliobacillus]|uniref:glycine betaine ABC transporter substrate-binding protein n=1 Tax=Paraliobacillus TaxID=200903 RepID=UPI000DD32CCC|nr:MULTISPECIES: glycine betaine ABC transporter substrate-binding protein [Paraliobacillus]